MLRFVQNREHVKLVGIGLSAENLRRLAEDQPIPIELDKPIDQGGLGLESGVMLFIFGGDTEESMTEDLRKAGLLGPNTTLIGPD